MDSKKGGHEKKVYKFRRSIFGLKRASRSWNNIFDEVIMTYSFDQNFYELCVYKMTLGQNYNSPGALYG